MLSVALIIGILLFLYPFVIYPALLIAIPFAGRKHEGPPEPRHWPTVALVICALNEQKIIRQKLENSRALRYPNQKLSLVFISDGSTDATADIIREYTASGVELIEHKTRRGKIANLNETLIARTEDILVLSDANVIYDRDAIGHLVANFYDPLIGGVSGKVILTDSAPVLGGPTQNYYSVEWLLQEKASDIYAMPGTDGAMYALRRELFRPCPNDTIIEDFVIAMQIVGLGRRMVFEPKALGWEQGAASLREEFRRKVRISAGAAQGLLRGNVWPRHVPLRFWFIFVSHKLLRWLSPLADRLRSSPPQRSLLLSVRANCHGAGVGQGRFRTADSALDEGGPVDQLKIIFQPRGLVLSFADSARRSPRATTANPKSALTRASRSTRGSANHCGRALYHATP